jgi:hypothetical protein
MPGSPPLGVPIVESAFRAHGESYSPYHGSPSP